MVGYLILRDDGATVGVLENELPEKYEFDEPSNSYRFFDSNAGFTVIVQDDFMGLLVRLEPTQHVEAENACIMLLVDDLKSKNGWGYYVAPI